MRGIYWLAANQLASQEGKQVSKQVHLSDFIVSAEILARKTPSAAVVPDKQ